jgi:hypothetical protein
MVLYALTISLSAFLLFQVQPVIAKMILPWFGGTSAVWSTCMLFFQMVLLLGYLYAHWLQRLGVQCVKVGSVKKEALCSLLVLLRANRGLPESLRLKMPHKRPQRRRLGV